MTQQQLYVNWRLSFYTRAIAFRYLLTPLGTVTRDYQPLDNGVILRYLDVYIFGIRIARLNKA